MPVFVVVSVAFAAIVAVAEVAPALVLDEA